METTSRFRFFEVRMPSLFYVIAVLSAMMAILPWVAPGFTGGSEPSIALTVVEGSAAVLLAGAATLTLVLRRRGVWAIDRAPHAQESDPRSA